MSGPPDLVVVGAPKAGTTTLAAWLAAHPQVAMSPTKELQFLDVHHSRGLDWYRAQLPPAAPGTVVAEATPTYLAHPLAPGRAATDLPGARFVAVLREPVSRAWSQYWFFRMLGVERRSWATSREEHLALGRYAEQVDRWDAAVGRDRLLLLLFDDLLADAAGLFAQVCRFAGVRDDVAPSSAGAVNPTSRPRSGTAQWLLRDSGLGRTRLGRRAFVWNSAGGPPPALDADEAALLRTGFAEHNARLAGRLGRPLPAGWS